MARQHSKQLAVEATDDKGVVIGLMQHFIEWGNEREAWPVHIVMANSAAELLEPVYLNTMWKSSGLDCFGVVVDADSSFQSRWDMIRNFCRQHFKSVPKNSPREGLILDTEDGRRFGAWIMPDNTSAGMLETFCRTLVPPTSGPLWTHAEDSVARAKELGAPYNNVHLEKANIHTWLAWQDPPGERMGIALTSKILDPKGQGAKPFVEWFVKLFELEVKE